LAREKGEQLIERDAIAQSAQARGDQIIAQARAESEATRRDADEYVLETLTHIELELDRLITQVRNGIQTVKAEKVK
jgi:hypothetical protein